MKRAQKARGVPLDELLAAHAAGDDGRLGALVGRYRGSVVPASTIAAKSGSTPKPLKATAKNALGARLARSDDPQVIPIDEPRLVGYARLDG